MPRPSTNQLLYYALSRFNALPSPSLFNSPALFLHLNDEERNYFPHNRIPEWVRKCRQLTSHSPSTASVRQTHTSRSTTHGQRCPRPPVRGSSAAGPQDHLAEPILLQPYGYATGLIHICSSREKASLIFKEKAELAALKGGLGYFEMWPVLTAGASRLVSGTPTEDPDTCSSSRSSRTTRSQCKPGSVMRTSSPF